MQLQWTKTLAQQPLCQLPETCADTYMVNAAAISDDGAIVAGATYFYHYQEPPHRQRVDGRFGLYVYDTATGNTRLAHEFDADQGIYTVAMSGDGATVAGGGLLADADNGAPSMVGILLAFDIATQTVLLDDRSFAGRVTSIALSRDGSVLVATAAQELRIYLRGSAGTFSAPPSIITLLERCEMVAVKPDGTWAAAADMKGTVYVVPIAGGAIGATVTWTSGSTQFHSVAIARSADALVVGGDRKVNLLTWQAGALSLAATFSAGVKQEVRWVAIADDGSFVTASLTRTGGNGKNELVKLVPSGAALMPHWRRLLGYPPNSTSIDEAGAFITVATGHPNLTGGSFTLFDAAGNQVGTPYITTDMNWPMWISRNGAGIIAGSDDNTLFFFTP